jgi:hypothetical protein
MHFFKGLLAVLERQKADQLHHLAEFRQVLLIFLYFLQSVAHCVCLVNGLEEGVAHRALVEKEGGHCRCVV